jgi:septin family protein
LGSSGRTTFVNTLCGKSVLNHKESDDANSAHNEEGVKIRPITVGSYNPAAVTPIAIIY